MSEFKHFRAVDFMHKYPPLKGRLDQKVRETWSVNFKSK